MSELIVFLEKRFPCVEYGKGWNNGDLTHSMFVEFGVNVQIEGLFYQMKYEMTVLTNWSVVCQQCRGIIVTRHEGAWRIASLPFFKFFNQNEVECPLSNAKTFDAMASDISFVEKADGTGIQLWYCGEDALQRSLDLMRQEQSEDGTISHRKERDDEVHAQILSKLREGNFVSNALSKPKSEALLTPDERRTLMYHRNKKTGLAEGVRMPRMTRGWRISTFGRITPAEVFENLFWTLFFGGDESAARSLDSLDREVTYLFELCGSENKVVTEYPTDRLYLIAGRHRRNMEPFRAGWSAGVKDVLSPQVLDDVCKALANPRIMRPYCAHAPVKTLQEALRFVEDQSRRNDMGKTPEGFVLCYQGVPLAKMKNSGYLSRHGLMTGPLLYCRGIVIERFFAGTLDDVDECLSEPLRRFAEELKGKVKIVTAEALLLWKETVKGGLLAYGEGVGRAQISQHIATVVPTKYAPFFYRQITALLAQDAGFEPMFLDWLKKNYHLKGFGKFWKETEIQDFVLAEKLNNGELRLQMAEKDFE